MTEETKLRGFGGMDPARQREIASAGGRAAHRTGRAHTWTTETAREASRKGAMVKRAKKEEANKTADS